jgi:predicted RNA binding protein YcfA (HicA-like mRNA interferase family)
MIQRNKIGKPPLLTGGFLKMQGKYHLKLFKHVLTNTCLCAIIKEQKSIRQWEGIMKFRELDKILRENGWERDFKGTGSSHIMYRKNGRKVPVPNHNGDIPTGTLKAIYKQTRLK